MNIAIVGVGLIGGSIAITLKEKKVATRIVGVDKNEANLKKALHLGLSEEGLTLDDAVKACDVIFITVPVDTILKMLPDLLDPVPNQVVIDMDSTEERIFQAIQEHPKRGH